MQENKGQKNIHKWIAWKYKYQRPQTALTEDETIDGNVNREV